MYMYNIFIIHFSVEGYLGCLHFLASMTRTVMKVNEHVSLE